jgi:hypothetical protein
MVDPPSSFCGVISTEPHALRLRIPEPDLLSRGALLFGLLHMPRVAHLGHYSPPSRTLRASWNDLSSDSWLTYAPTVATSAPAESLVVRPSAGAPHPSTPNVYSISSGCSHRA